MGPSVGNDGVMSYWLHISMPDQAAKTWENLRENLVRIEDDDVEIEATRWEMLDPGNYTLGTGMSRVSVMAAAKEFGDNELANALERSLDKRYEVVRQNGARAYSGISSWGDAGHVLARAAYPDVLVTRAVTDGQATVAADDDGCALVTVELDDRREVLLRPAAP
jgi:hypothetical protein